MRGVGLNLRLTTNLLDLIDQATRLNLPFFQCFLTFQHNGQYITFDKEEYLQFLLRKNNTIIYAHGSYKINLANAAHRNDSYYFLKKELEIARMLECNYLVVHPGSATEGHDHNQAIDNIAKRINKVLYREDYPTILLENVAFGNKTIGGDIYDLAAIRSKLDKPERVHFCLDTAHAYSFGYNIANPVEQNAFIDLVEKLLGIESIALIHLNDTKEQCGIQRDRHDIPGQGNIGTEALKQFILDPRLKQIPLMLELSVLPEEKLKAIVDEVNSWRNI